MPRARHSAALPNATGPILATPSSGRACIRDRISKCLRSCPHPDPRLGIDGPCAAVKSARLFRAGAARQARRTSPPPKAPGGRTVHKRGAGAHSGPPVRTGCRRTSCDPPCYLRRCLRRRTHRYEYAAFGFGAELDLATDQSKQRVVLTDADVAAGMPLVPRWRAMMLPASTCAPPKIFSPRR